MYPAILLYTLIQPGSQNSVCLLLSWTSPLRQFHFYTLAHEIGERRVVCE